MSTGPSTPVITNPGTKSNAAAALQDYQNLAHMLNNVLAILANLQLRERNNAYESQYNNTQTYAVNPDGTPGAVDPTPVLTHPMVGTYLTANDVSGFQGYIVNDLYSFLTGVAGPTVADRRPAIYSMLPSGPMNFACMNLEVMDGLVQSTTPPAAHQVLATLRIVFGLRPTCVRPSSIRGEVEYYGRVRSGAELPLELQCLRGRGVAPTGVAWPDTTPVQRIYAYAGGPTRSGSVPLDPHRGGAVGVFRGDFRPGSLDQPGHYLVLFNWAFQGTSVFAPGVFEVIPGGHPSGAIMTTFSFVQPAGASLIAHHEAGRVTRGLRPYLDTGD